MRNSLIIDSNETFAKKLYELLNGQNSFNNEVFWNTSTHSKLELGRISDDISSKLSDETIIFINAEAKTSDGNAQEQNLAELAFWFRCKHRIKNPIVFYGSCSINRLLVDKPQNFILLSPGCYYLKFPFSQEDIQKIANSSKLENLNLIKQFLKPRINLDKTRHTFANYSGMVLMMNIANQVNNPQNKSFRFEPNILEKLKYFSNSIDYYLLSFYYDLTKTNLATQNTDNLKINNPKCKILLVDDLADGWKPIISQMIYGNSNDAKIDSIKIKTNKINEISHFNFDETKKELKSKIKNFKPHLILLDLRLNDEKDVQDVETLGGFRLLKHIKSSPILRGLPVVMITASSNAETTKKLIEAGAESVWIKPGIDEGLNSDKIIERYKSLIDIMQAIFTPNFNILNSFDGEYLVKGGCNFDKLRNQLLKKLEFIKYRCSLYKETELLDKTPSQLASFDIIYFDSNSLITGSNKVRFADLISSFYLLSLLTSNSTLDILTKKMVDANGKYVKDANELFMWEDQTTIELPKVVVMNVIYDEIIKLAKIDSKNYTHSPHKRTDVSILSEIRASNALIVLKELFDEKKIRTELNQYNTEFKLLVPKENVYADGHVIDEIGTVLVTKQQKSYGFKTNCRVLFVCDEKGLFVKLDKFNDGNNFQRLKLDNFIQIMSQVEI